MFLNARKIANKGKKNVAEKIALFNLNDIKLEHIEEGRKMHGCLPQFI